MKVDIPALNINGLDIPELAYLELTPQNVMRILFACRVTEEVEGESIETVSFISSKSAGRQVPTVKFDVKKLYAYDQLIRYFVGQLQFVHREKDFISVAEGILNYKGEKWITDNRHLYALYFLATGNVLFPKFIVKDQRIVSPDLSIFYLSLPPTFSPSDPNFRLEQAAGALKDLGAKLPDHVMEYCMAEYEKQFLYPIP